MVQRSITRKLNFQLEDDDQKNRLITTRNNKVLRRPSSPRYHDAKNRGSAAADLKIKKKMKKKSRSLKTPPDFVNINPFARQPPPGNSSPSPEPTEASPTPKKMQQTPNYMKSTSSFDAKKEMITSPRPQVSVKDSPITKISSSTSRHGPKTSLTKSSTLKILRKTISFKASRTSLKKSPPVLLDVKRATCSSTLKETKFPTFLELNPAGTAVLKVCPYTYCSLNGHHHDPLPPLKRFISSMRQMLKTGRHKTTKPAAACLSLPAKILSAPEEEKENVDLFVDVYVKNEVNGNDQESIDLDIPSTDNIESKYSEEALEMDWEEAPDQVSSEIDKLDDNLGDGYSIDHDWNGQGNPEDDIPIMDLDYPINDDMNEQAEDETPITDLDYPIEDLNEKKGDEGIDDLNGRLEDEIPRIDLDQLGENKKEVEDIHAKDKKEVACTRQERNVIEVYYELKIVKSNRGIGEWEEHIGGFNPKQPNYLEIEGEAEAEKVDLKHQEVEEKKNCKEWMLDYAIQQAINKMGPATARKRRVSLLVEAFEKVIPIPKYFGKSHPSKVAVFATAHSRPIQACS